MPVRGLLLPLLLLSACPTGGDPCGPGAGVVARVVDGDTIVLESGERVRYLLVDTPESTGGADDCFGREAAMLNRELVLGREVTLAYDDAQCTDRFGRLLAYVRVAGREVNTLLVERGHACVLYLPPAGRDRRDEFEALESAARSGSRGMWGVCEVVACER